MIRPGDGVALNAGAKLGAYEVLSVIGAGGMGEVYRARDAKLNRDVALKILPEIFASDPERVARFRREAQVLAALNHPHIAHIHGFEDSGATHALVMELVEGPTLAECIAAGPIEVGDAIPIARQIAEALEAAHEQGIVHRDLKPANVKVRDDGTVKVLDFGLAKALDPAATSTPDAMHSPTLTARSTQLGVILGTAAYMSPEQARGKTVDKRADIWAFGCVLYEMLTGRRTFEGEEVSDTLAAVLRQEVDWTALPAPTPPAIRRLLARCLERDPKKRLRDIGEARLVLDDPTTTDAASASTARPTTAPPVAPELPWTRAFIFALTMLVACAAAGWIGWLLREPPRPVVMRFPIPLGEGQAFTNMVRHFVAVSPDGNRIAYVATPGRLYVRAIGSQTAAPVPGLTLANTVASAGVTDPAFSADGRWIAFFSLADSTIKKIPIDGRAATTLCPAINTYGISWSGDSIFFGQGTRGIIRVSSSGGSAETVIKSEEGVQFQMPRLLPDGEHVLFGAARGTSGIDRWDQGAIYVQSLKTGVRKKLVDGGSDAQYVATGHLLYAASGVVYAVSFDPSRLEVHGAPIPVVEGVRRGSGGLTGAALYEVADNGTLVYVGGPVKVSSDQRDVAVMDRRGTLAPLKLPPAVYGFPRASPDGKQLAVETDDGKEAIVWIYEMSGTTALRRLTFGSNNRSPIWSRDSRRVTYQSDRDGASGVFWQAADGTGAPERLTTAAKGETHTPEAWSKDGQTLLFGVRTATGESISMLAMRDRSISPFKGVQSMDPITPAFSPDGKWVAYATTTGAGTTVYVEPFPQTGAKYQLPTRPGESPHHPVWSPDGKELFYNPTAPLFEVIPVETSPVLAFGKPVQIPKNVTLGPAPIRTNYDVLPSGKLVGIVMPGGEPTSLATQPIQVVLNWFEELKQRAPVSR
jgi:eukaryotic-like serine/threonine-protein kinase